MLSYCIRNRDYAEHLMFILAVSYDLQSPILFTVAHRGFLFAEKVLLGFDKVLLSVGC